MEFELDDSKYDISKRFGQWRYDFSNDRLYQVSEDGTEIKFVPLENICQKTLSYLLKNHSRLITREELLENVWGVKGVSFSRVYRVISLLRSTLDDNALDPVFIVTVKKVGFKFTGFDRSEDVSEDAQKKLFYTDFYYQIGAGASVIILIVFLFLYKNTAEKEVHLTAENLESQFSLARDFTYNHDGSVLAYIGANKSEPSFLNDEKKNLVLIKSEKKEYVTINLPSELSNVITPSWHPFENKIAYRTAFRTKYCKLWVATLNTEMTKIAKNELVGECSKDYFFSGFVHWTKDGNGLIYSDLANSSANMAIFHLNLKTNIANQLTSPPRSSVGDYHVSESPDGGSLLFLRDDSRALAQLWTINLDTLEQKPIFKFREGVYPRFVEWDRLGRGFLYREPDNSIQRLDMESLKTSLYSDLKFEVQSLIAVGEGRYLGTVKAKSKQSIIKVKNPFLGGRSSEQVEHKPSALYAFNPHTSLPDAFFTVGTNTIEQWLEYKDGNKRLLRKYPFAHFNADQMFSYDGEKLLAWVGAEVWAGRYEEEPKLLNKEGQIFMRPSWGASNAKVYAIEPKNDWSVVSIDITSLEQKVYLSGIWFFKQSHNGRFEVIVKVNSDIVVLRDLLKNTYTELSLPDYTRDKEINVVFFEDDIYIKCFRCTLPGAESEQVIFRVNTLTNKQESMSLVHGSGDNAFAVISNGEELLIDSVIESNNHNIVELTQE